MKHPDPSPKSGAGGGERFAVDWAARAGAVDELLHELDRRAKRRRNVAALSGACLLVLVSFAWRLSRTSMPPPQNASPAIVTLPPREVLPDGSIVELNEGARISLAFTATERRVALVHGEAHFQVAKDALKPFVVAVGPIEVRAVGTEFSVQRGGMTAEVLVTEGSVRVGVVASPVQVTATPSPGNGHSAALVEAGNRVTVNAALPAGEPVPVEAVAEAEITRRLAWRLPRLEFSGTPLGEAVAMFNRYNEEKFVLEAPGLADLRISGFLRADKSDTFVSLLEADFGLRAERRERQIILRRAK